MLSGKRFYCSLKKYCREHIIVAAPVYMAPVYMQMENAEARGIANVVIHGSAPIEGNPKLGKLPSPAKTLLVNHNILSD